jgi:hypothetical protein
MYYLEEIKSLKSQSNLSICRILLLLKVKKKSKANPVTDREGP